MLFTSNDHSGPTYMTDFPIILMAWTPVKVFKNYIHFAPLLSVSTSMYNYIPFSLSYLTANVLLTHHGICYNTLTHSRLFISLILQKLYLLCSQEWISEFSSNGPYYCHMKICLQYQGEKPCGSGQAAQADPAFMYTHVYVCVVPSKPKFYCDSMACNLIFKKPHGIKIWPI